tara:strand:+ start:1730 stop:2128 length:399 start_codon:yes stop_codon:yes gene_type:complete
MITVVDTNILLDILMPNRKYLESSKGLLKEAFDSGALVINEIIYSELSPQFKNKEALDKILQTLNIKFVNLNDISSYHAGQKWNEYRKAGGKRERIIPDFLIGAFAVKQADRLLTRDRGFYKKYFKGLKIMN